MPLWASWLKDFDILNIFYDELKIEKMAKFEILIATNGLNHFPCVGGRKSKKLIQYWPFAFMAP